MISKEQAISMLNEEELFSLIHEIKTRMEDKKLLQIDNPILDYEIRELAEEMKNDLEKSIYLGKNDEITQLKDELIFRLGELGDWQEQDEIINSFLDECREKSLGSHSPEELI